ncbi:MAG TPA: rhodanese-like domain-containing protein, partial [Roseomonas sp.]|nr:rhodanese-like domain-containing protein [Roseomonas sp.]
MQRITPATLKTWLHDGGEIALLDVREHGEYGQAHPFHAIPLPYSRLELDVGRLVPRPATRIVVFDDGTTGVAEHAAARLAAMGYSALHVLEGGTAAWQAAGHVLFAGVNVPSK